MQPCVPTRCETFTELVERYGDPGSDGFALKLEQDHMTLWTATRWAEKNPDLFWKGNFHRIYCNRDMIPALDAAFTNLHLTGAMAEIVTLDGCWNVRKTRGRHTWSLHSFGIALDFNAALNPLGSETKFSEKYLRCWEAAGFTVGARFARKDGMHMQYAGDF